MRSHRCEGRESSIKGMVRTVGDQIHSARTSVAIAWWCRPFSVSEWGLETSTIVVGGIGGIGMEWCRHRMIRIWDAR